MVVGQGDVHHGADHDLPLTDHDVLRSGYDTRFKMAPPLRSAADRDALIEGLADGTIDAIATDHAPHSRLEKDLEFAEAANGVIGLETAVPLPLDLVQRGLLTRARAIDALTVAAARCFGLQCGTLGIGSPADIAVIDPDDRWTVDAEGFESKSRNSPFVGRTMRGRTGATFVGGEAVYRVAR